MLTKSYSEKLRDPRWQKKRIKIMEYANWRCQICGDKKSTLNVHHSYYTKGKQPWQYPDGALICLCESCHKKIHPERVNSANSTATTAHKESPKGITEDEIAKYSEPVENIRDRFASIYRAIGRAQS